MGNIVNKMLGVLLHPWESMGVVKSEGDGVGLKPSILFIVIVGVVSGVISSIWGFILPPPPVAAGEVSRWSILLAIPLVPLISFLLSFVGAFILWGLVLGFLKGSSADYRTMYRLFALLSAFSPLNALLSPIPTVGPWLGVAINIWGVVVLIRGIILVFSTPPVRSGVILGLIFLALLALGLVFRAETQRQLAGGPDFAGLNTGANFDDLGDEEALNKELEEMANKAKAEAAGQKPK
jgi:hypothetical protein